MKNKGLNQKDTAEKLSVDQGSLSRWLNGTRLPSVEIAQHVHRITRGEVSLFDWSRIAN